MLRSLGAPVGWPPVTRGEFNSETGQYFVSEADPTRPGLFPRYGWIELNRRPLSRRWSGLKPNQWEAPAGASAETRGPCGRGRGNFRRPFGQFAIEDIQPGLYLHSGGMAPALLGLACRLCVAGAGPGRWAVASARRSGGASARSKSGPGTLTEAARRSPARPWPARLGVASSRCHSARAGASDRERSSQARRGVAMIAMLQRRTLWRIPSTKADVRWPGARRALDCIGPA
jgi:hypothetical protein